MMMNIRFLFSGLSNYIQVRCINFLTLNCVGVEKRVSAYTQAGHKQDTVVTSLLDVTEI